MIGWYEISHASLKSSSISQYWARAENAKKAVEKGVKIIMSPAKKTYLDMKYDSTTRIGLSWAAHIEIDSAYIWNPDTMVDGITKNNILGIDSPLWTETVTTMDDIEYLVFPRLICHAEVGWTTNSERNWENFRIRLGNHGKFLKTKKIDFYQSKLIDWNN